MQERLEKYAYNVRRINTDKRIAAGLNLRKNGSCFAAGIYAK